MKNRLWVATGRNIVESLDIELLEWWVGNRDAEAFAEIVARHSSMVYGTCRRVLGNGSEAEDVAQECFLELAQAGSRVKRSLGAWLHVTCVHRSLDRLKAERRRLRREATFARVSRDSGETSRANAEETDWNDVAPHVDEAIAQLPELVRELVVQRYLEGKSLESIAQDTGLARSTVQYRLGKGISSVREALRRQGFPVSTHGLCFLMTENLRVLAPATLTRNLGKFALTGLEKVTVNSVVAGAKPPVLGGLIMTWKGVTGVVVGTIFLGALCLFVAGGTWKRNLPVVSQGDAARLRGISSSVADSAAQHYDSKAGSGTNAGIRALSKGEPGNDAERKQGTRDPVLNRLMGSAILKFLEKHGPGTSGRPTITSSEIPAANGAHFFLLAAELFPKEELDFHGRLDFLDAMLKEFLETGSVSDPAKLQEIFDSCRASIDAIRKGLETGNVEFPTPRVDDELPYLARFRELNRVMAMQGLMQSASGDYSGALDTYKTALDFANASPRGGAFINTLVGYAMDDITMGALSETLVTSVMTADDYRYVISELQRHEAEAIPIAEQAAAESQALTSYLSGQLTDVGRLRQALLDQAPTLGIPADQVYQLSDADIAAYAEGLKNDYAQMADYFALTPYEALSTDRSLYYDSDNPFSESILNSIFDIQASVARNQAETRGAEVMAALELYRTEHGTYPPSLDSLAPECLTRVPFDPFTEGPFAYAATESGYTLYSAGRDMEYNTGAVNDYKAPGGDLVLHRTP